MLSGVTVLSAQVFLSPHIVLPGDRWAAEGRCLFSTVLSPEPEVGENRSPTALLARILSPMARDSQALQLAVCRLSCFIVTSHQRGTRPVFLGRLWTGNSGSDDSRVRGQPGQDRLKIYTHVSHFPLPHRKSRLLDLSKFRCNLLCRILCDEIWWNMEAFVFPGAWIGPAMVRNRLPAWAMPPSVRPAAGSRTPAPPNAGTGGVVDAQW